MKKLLCLQWGKTSLILFSNLIPDVTHKCLAHSKHSNICWINQSMAYNLALGLLKFDDHLGCFQFFFITYNIAMLILRIHLSIYILACVQLLPKNKFLEVECLGQKIHRFYVLIHKLPVCNLISSVWDRECLCLPISLQPWALSNSAYQIIGMKNDIPS